MSTIAITRETSLLTDGDVDTAITALQAQLDHHFRPTWGHTAHLYAGAPQHPADWQIALLDDSDQAGALGYHDLTSAGKPLAKVFVATDRQYGLNWTVTLSHELLEMVGDPWLNTTAQVGSSTFYAYEACDAVEADELGYKIGTVQVSDFVLPRWFSHDEDGHFVDWCGHLQHPLELAPGGYIGVWTPSAGWHQKTADGMPAPVDPDDTRSRTVRRSLASGTLSLLRRSHR